jgi:hypothetical protein
MSEEGKRLLKDLARQVREKVTTSGAPLLHQRGLDLVDELVKELSAPEGLPGLKVHRDSPTKFRAQRSPRNAELTVEWERDIGALGLTCQKHGEPKSFVRYVWDPTEARWRKLDGGGEIFADLTAALVEYLYPEMKPPA